MINTTDLTLTFHMKALRAMSRTQITQIGAELLSHDVTVEDLKNIIKEGKFPLKIAFAMCILKVIQKGDIKALSEITELITGNEEEEQEQPEQQYQQPTFRLFD